MQDGLNQVGTGAGAGAQRRPVNAESFRRLTALLKKPAAADVPAAELVIPDLQPSVSIPALETASEPQLEAGFAHEPQLEADFAHEPQLEAGFAHEPQLEAGFAHEPQLEADFAQHEAAPPPNPAQALAPSDLEAAEFSPNPEPEPEVAFETAPAIALAEPLLEPLPFEAPQSETGTLAEQGAAEPAFSVLPEPEDEVPALAAETALEVAPAPEAEAEIPVLPEAVEETEALAVEPSVDVAPAFEAEAVAVEPEVEEVLAAQAGVEEEPTEILAEPETAEAVAGVEDSVLVFEAAPAAAVETPTVLEPVPPPATPVVMRPDARPSPVRLAPLRPKKADAFSLLPETATPRRLEPEILLTPEQEAESADLAQSLMDMMAASAGGGQPQERALASDTLLRLLPRLPARTRTTLAQRLTMMDAPPPFLVAKLIADKDLSVSGPLLEDCMHISDEDLLQLVASGDPDKRRLIARRRRISRPVTEALAATEDTSVLLTLVRNQGAEISAEGFALLAHAAVNNAELLPPLCTRQDLPVHFAFELFWLAPAQLRRYLLSRFLTDSENLTKILRITMDTHGNDQAPQQGGLDLDSIGQALERFMAAETSVAGRDEQIAVLAAGAKVKPATVERILQDDQGEPLMALLKVLGVPRSMLEAEMHQFAAGSLHLIDPTRNLSEVQAVFDQLSFTKARILLTYWDWATTNSGPYAPVN